MVSTQPEALYLADALERDVGAQLVNRKKAADELRRLHALNQELLEALKTVSSAVSSINSGTQHAIEVNEERVYWQREEWVRWMLDEILPNARAAIAKAEAQP